MQTRKPRPTLAQRHRRERREQTQPVLCSLIIGGFLLFVAANIYGMSVRYERMGCDLFYCPAEVIAAQRAAR